MLRKRMLTVWSGDTTDEVAHVGAADVEQASFGPAVGGLWWRFSLVDAGPGLVLRGRGDGVEHEAELREWLGDRLVTTWLHAPARMRSVRNWVGRVGVCVGASALLLALVIGAARPDGVTGSVPLVLALVGFVGLGLAVLPDLADDLDQRFRRRRISATETAAASKVRAVRWP